MEDYLQSALDIVKAQASARPMTEDEIVSMVRSVANGIAALSTGQIAASEAESAAPAQNRLAAPRSGRRHRTGISDQSPGGR